MGNGDREEASAPAQANTLPPAPRGRPCGPPVGQDRGVTPPSVLPLDQTLDRQRQACAQLGSTLYARLLDGIAADVAAGGVCAAVLGPHAGDSLNSALPLRFLGAVHRLVLDGRAPALAAHYPSVGGTPGPGLVDDFLAAVADQRPEVEARLPLGVQTNEVGRSAALVGGYAEVARRSRLPLRVLEVGASAGLNLRWDHYWYDTGASTLGDPESPVRFTGAWATGGAGPPDLAVAGGVTVADREGCDRHPLDPATEEGRRTLRSYLWPDQVDRRARLDAALAVAARVPAAVAGADVGDWLADRLAAPAEDRATVVVHSIVWQYVAPESRDRMRAALRRRGAAATPEAPLAWLRLEPAGAVADLRLTWWPGGDEQVLGTAGYHGTPVVWGPPAP
jgi:hypothetical protein